jgi:hypothetical protein
MPKKTTTTTGVSGGTANAQDPLQTLYMAHQVHTLAQLVYQQVAAGQQPPMGPWAPPAGPVFTAPQVTPGWGGAYQVPGTVPGPHSPNLLYWYP